MAFWLAKTEPETYSYSDLEQLGQDRWNGVRNFSALKHIKAMQPGDLVFIYHTGKEKAITGVAKVTSAAYPDPDLGDPRFVVFDTAPLYRLQRPVTLKEIKQSGFTGWELVTQPRLSVMPVSAEHWERVLSMAKP